MAAAIGSRAHADPEFRTAPAALLLRDLEDGDLDVVFGDFAKDSPWSSRVTLAPPPAGEDGASGEPLLRPALRKGENRWYMFVESALKGEAA